jgi:TolB-like protein
MKQTIIFILSCFILCTLCESKASAGQVVSDDDRTWAKTAISQEQSQETIAAPNTLAVLAFRNKTGQTSLDPLQKGFAFMLMTDLHQVEGIQLVERVKLQAILEELHLGASGIVDSNTSPQVGKLLGASYLVGGDITGPQPPEIAVASDLLQVKDQSSLGQPSANGQRENIFDMEKKVLFEIIELLKVRLTKAQKEKLKRPLTTSYRALMYLSMGLDASDRGNYGSSDLYYRKALEHDPQLAPANDAIKELRDLKLVTVNPRSSAVLATQEEQNSSTLSTKKNISTFREFRPAASGEIRVRW